MIPIHWICSRCSHKHPDKLLRGRRFRFAGETCPECENPGVGMVLLFSEDLKTAKSA